MASTIDPDDFLARLRRARRTLEDEYAATDAGRRTSRLLARLEARLSRPFRVVVLGEANSGKTTLINRILGSDLLATDVIQNTRSVVRVRHAAQAAVEICSADGRRLAIKQGSTEGLSLGPGAIVEVSVPLPRLGAIEIVDTPGFLADEPGAERWAATQRATDISIWCTIATQAWRASELAAWRSLGRPAASSLLAVTRADLLGEGDREKVERRLATEAGTMFRAIVMVARGSAGTSAAIAARLDAIVLEMRQARCQKAAAIVRRLSQRLEASGRAKSELILATSGD
jgi:GTPase Era involved in 16S rRNA processing